MVLHLVTFASLTIAYRRDSQERAEVEDFQNLAAG